MFCGGIRCTGDQSYREMAATMRHCCETGVSPLSDSATTWSNVGPSIPITGDNIQFVWREDRVFSCPLAPTTTTRNMALPMSETVASP